MPTKCVKLKLVTLQPDSKIEDMECYQTSIFVMPMQAMKERVQDMESMSDLPQLAVCSSHICWRFVLAIFVQFVLCWQHFRSGCVSKRRCVVAPFFVR